MLKIILVLLLCKISGQQFISADPFNIIRVEQHSFSDSNFSSNLMIRPIINIDKTKNWSIRINSDFYSNNNAPNLENKGNRFFGKGLGLFTSINFSYAGEYFSFSIEPFYTNNQNLEVKQLERGGIFSRLNDNQTFKESPYISNGLRETQFYFHYKQFGFGYSNANMWWGPGIHNTLTMTNNTSGFPHFMLGTLNEKRIGKIGINFRYVFAHLKKTIGNPYFTSLVWSFKLFSDPIITIGLSRNYISGGLPTDRPFTSLDAALLVFEELLVDTKIIEYPSDWEAHDPWDQTMSGYFTLEFPRSKLKLYLELGTNDHRQNWSDLRAHPDHAAASIFGLRKYDIFNNNSLLFGIEYTNLILAKTWKFRGTPNWYNRDYYDYSSYNDRRWAAHSGSDSDDLFIYFGFKDNKWSFIPSLNYERHGVIYNRPPEVKMEIRLDIKYNWKDYCLKVYFEQEWLEHAGFIEDNWRIGNVIVFGVERNMDNLFSERFRFYGN